MRGERETVNTQTAVIVIIVTNHAAAAAGKAAKVKVA